MKNNKNKNNILILKGFLIGVVALFAYHLYEQHQLDKASEAKNKQMLIDLEMGNFIRNM